MAARAPYLQRRGNTLTFRIAVPPDLWGIIGRREITLALGTSDTRKAVPEALQLAGMAKRVFEEAKEVTGTGGKDSASMSGAEIHEALHDLHSEIQAETNNEHAARVQGILNDFEAERAKIDRRHKQELRGAQATASRVHDDALRIERIRAEAQREALLSAMQVIQKAPATALTDEAPASVQEPLPAMVVFDAWAKAQGAKPKTVDSFRSRLSSFINFVGHDDLRRVTRRDAIAWKDDLIQKSGLKANTIRNGYLATLHAICAYACDNAGMEANPFSRIRVAADDDDQGRLPFSDSEARMILVEARKAGEAVYRWTPFVLAYTGCRIEEVVGANADDVRQEGGIWVLDLTSKRRRLKNKQSRRVIPLHQALIDEGFVEYAQSLPPHSPLFPAVVPDKYLKSSASVSKKLARQLRNLGISDSRKVAGHSWRHRFVDLCRNAGIPEEHRLRLTGHADHKVGNAYGVGPQLRVLKTQIDLIQKQG